MFPYRVCNGPSKSHRKVSRLNGVTPMVVSESVKDNDANKDFNAIQAPFGLSMESDNMVASLVWVAEDKADDNVAPYVLGVAEVVEYIGSSTFFIVLLSFVVALRDKQ